MISAVTIVQISNFMQKTSLKASDVLGPLVSMNVCVVLQQNKLLIVMLNLGASTLSSHFKVSYWCVWWCGQAHYVVQAVATKQQGVITTGWLKSCSSKKPLRFGRWATLPPDDTENHYIPHVLSTLSHILSIVFSGSVFFLFLHGVYLSNGAALCKSIYFYVSH